MIDKTRKQVHNMIITGNIPYLHKSTFYLTLIIQHLLINVLQITHTYTLTIGIQTVTNWIRTPNLQNTTRAL